MAGQTGLRNIYVAKILKDDSTGTVYATPMKLEKAIKATLKVKASRDKIYSDDVVEGIIDNFEGVDVDIELNQLSLSSRAFLQGSKLIKGQLIENKDDIPPELAFGFQSKKRDKAQRYVWLYKGSFSKTDDLYETDADKTKIQTAGLTGSFYPRVFDGNYRTIADSDEANIDTAVTTGWFGSVATIPAGSVATTMTVIAGMTGIATSVVTTVATIKTGSTVAQAKTALQVDAGKGTFVIWASSAKTAMALDIATVVNTMVIEATAEDGTTKATYTIVVA